MTSYLSSVYLEADVNNGNYLTFYIADAAASSVTAYPKGVTTLATRSWQIEVSYMNLLELRT